MLTEQLEIIKEVKDLTKLCYRVESEVSVVKDKQQSLRERSDERHEEIYAALGGLKSLILVLQAEVENQGKKIFSVKQMAFTVLKYWHPLILFSIYSLVNPPFAHKLFESAKHLLPGV